MPVNTSARTLADSVPCVVIAVNLILLRQRILSALQRSFAFASWTDVVQEFSNYDLQNLP